MQHAHDPPSHRDNPGCEHEQQLIASAQTGCADSFGALMERYQLDVVRYLVRRTGDHELAADLTQETFLDAFRRLDRYQPDRPFPAWLFRIAHFNLLHEWRRARSRRSESLDSMLAHGGDTVRALHAPDRSEQLPERDQIARALASLAPALREPLLLRSVYGFSGDEIAAQLGISHMAARQRISRGREAFQRRYAAADAHEPA